MHEVQKLVEIVGAIGDKGDQRRGRQRRPEPVWEQPRGALVGQMLRGDQVDALRPDPGPVLRRRADPGRKVSARDESVSAAIRTGP